MCFFTIQSLVLNAVCIINPREPKRVLPSSSVAICFNPLHVKLDSKILIWNTLTTLSLHQLVYVSDKFLITFLQNYKTHFEVRSWYVSTNLFKRSQELWIKLYYFKVKLKVLVVYVNSRRSCKITYNAADILKQDGNKNS